MKNKFFGVIEGFYRKPYTFKQRQNLITFLSTHGLNTYVYGPKADPFHRKKWYMPYPDAKIEEFRILNKLCKQHSIHFNYALSPLSYPDVGKIVSKIATMTRIGITHFSLLYDDIKVPLTRDTAIVQVNTANKLFDYLCSKIAYPMLFFCPTQYRGFDRTEYMLTCAKKLNTNIRMFWTGKRVVSTKIHEKDIDRITEIMRRPPLIWDNLFANDYIPGIILRFPYRYREPAIVQKVAGILINPMNQYKHSKPLIYTAARFFNDPYNYKPRKIWREAKSLDLFS
ncbi:hypothetical protein AMJ52_01625 [candidate division TA06 bacterium DG_78]|uniref:GH84 domain-containing protein n=1 Tax=candidate division TA06 bacterium DG_78 TaxID=1703772 RepID=A0A0S7YIU1_UNCT6|nr:MAG: hypothetical protein AMJ52_01625 [candidate division TA06 bacterium DG_78]